MEKTLLSLVNCISLLAVMLFSSVTPSVAREVISLNENWRSVCYPEGKADSLVSESVQLPHNWDDYYASRNQAHGSLHGTARYERVFHLGAGPEQEAFLRLDGAGSYVTVYLNGREVCRHRPAGRVSTTLDITPYLKSSNRLVIECEHPSAIADMPWVCGGCLNSASAIEGTAPLGLFRNVSVEVTDKVRIEPWGVHVWADASLDTLYVETEVRNYAHHAVDCLLQTMVEGRARRQGFSLGAQLSTIVRQSIPVASLGLKPWSPDYPQLYEITSTLMRGEEHLLADKVTTTTGFTTLRWPEAGSSKRFELNGEPVWLNAVGEYEHNFGQSHAFINDEIDRRVSLVKKMGFNTLSEVCLPHNLRYQEALDKQGTMQVSCFSGQVWHDTPDFRQNFKELLTQWVKERRNSPSLILWDVQAQSLLPKDFEQECIQLIHQLDGRRDRPVRAELGQQAAWLDLGHSGQRVAGDPDSELAWCDELHQSLCQAWKQQENFCGHFVESMFSASRPRSGRREFLRDVDNVGPYSGDGIFNAFWEPTEAYYLFVAWGAFLSRGAGSETDPTHYSATDMVKIGYKIDGIPMPDYLLTDAEKSAQRKLFGRETALLEGDPARAYIYRYNCGGDGLTDSFGHEWMGDDTRFSVSWAQAPQFVHNELNPMLGSSFEVPGWAIAVPASEGKPLQYAALKDQPLLRTHRFGRTNLHFRFPLPPKEVYLVDLFFVNTRHVVHHVFYKARVGEDGVLDVAFPNVKIGQAKVAAITISMPRFLARDYGKVDRAGNFRFNSQTEERLRDLVPAMRQFKGFPYSDGLTWKEVTEKK